MPTVPIAVPAGAAEMLNREFLEVRARLLQIAASLDRIGRAEGSAADGRLERIRQSLEILQGESAGRAERIQLLFSRPYEEAWRGRFGLEQD